jgi:hypothetical protein
MTSTVKPKKTLDDYVLEELKQNAAGVTTYDFYKKGVITPANAIERLRKKGHDIATERTTVVDDLKITHYRVALYKLENEYQGGAIDE